MASELHRRSTGRSLYIWTSRRQDCTSMISQGFGRSAAPGRQWRYSACNRTQSRYYKAADYLIDLGPEGGDGGGMIVAAGPPEEVVKVEGSYTGRYLNRSLNATKQNEEAASRKEAVRP
ncbi:hypothetical protein PO124_33855 [Bacillus licheniformis]|nr:hypothetical protein [Bacillus licheniformis]